MHIAKLLLRIVAASAMHVNSGSANRSDEGLAGSQAASAPGVYAAHKEENKNVSDMERQYLPAA